jgi:hypothetical protein
MPPLHPILDAGGGNSTGKSLLLHFRPFRQKTGNQKEVTEVTGWDGGGSWPLPHLGGRGRPGRLHFFSAKHFCVSSVDSPLPFASSRHGLRLRRRTVEGGSCPRAVVRPVERISTKAACSTYSPPDTAGSGPSAPDCPIHSRTETCHPPEIRNSPAAAAPGAPIGDPAA